jgi:hypothetical protein
MKSRLVLVLVAAIAASALWFPGLATAGTEAKTKVTIKGPNGDFHGKIKSDDDGCVGDRVVRLFMSDSADGPFERTGNSDTSEQQGDVGVWSMGNTGLRDGYFFAKAKKTPDCKGGKSKVLHLVDGVPQ